MCSFSTYCRNWTRCAVGIAALALFAHYAAGQSWEGDLQYPSAISMPASDAYFDADVDACANCDSPAPYCQHCNTGRCQCQMSLSDELTQRLTMLAKSMAESGITYGVVVPQFYQGVTSGGVDEGFEYGGKVDQFLILDSSKLGLWQGMTLTIHAETRFGQDVNNEAVGFSPVNVAMLYPNAGEHDTALTGFTFTQALSEELQLTWGKFNALDLFYTLYPQTGRGVNGFMNTAMVIPISIARVAPLSFNGAGALKLRGKQVQSGLLVYDTNDITTTSGFDELFDNGANIMAFHRFFTNIAGLPGSHMFGGVWSTGEFTTLDRTGFAFIPGQGIVAEQVGGAYTLLYVAEQTLWVDRCNKQRNVAFFSQSGFSDEETSPFAWSTNLAIQATGLNCRRPQDSLGVGYFYTGLSDDLTNLLGPIVTLDDVQGVELYYTAAVGKLMKLTADLQVIEPADQSNDTAVVVGLRATVGL